MDAYKLIPDPKTGIIYCHWYDPKTRRGERKSTRTKEKGAAKEWLAEWLIKTGRAGTQDTGEFAIVSACSAYWDGYAKSIPSAEAADVAIRWIEQFFRPDEPVSDLTILRQEAFIQYLRSQGHGNSYISRTLSVLRAALNWCQKRQIVMLVPKVIDVQADPVERFRLTPSQMRDVLDIAEKRTHMHRWCLLSIWTLARPETVLDLSPKWSPDFEAKTIRLNRPGRRQTKKYRPTVPMCATAAEYLPRWDNSDPYIQWGGESVASVKTGVKHIAGKLGLPIIPRTFRHTMGTELRKRGVPQEELSGIMGHSWKGAASTTERAYAEFDPEYLGKARKAIDGYCKELEI